MKNVIERIKRIKVDMLYGKKKHFNAADRKQSYHLFLGVPIIIINIITTSVLFYILTDNSKDIIKYLPIALTLVSALLSGLQTYLNFQRSAEAHRRIGNKYLFVLKKCDRLQSYIIDNVIDNKELIKEIEDISQTVDEINKDAESHPTSKKDYTVARLGIESGEENYNRNELEL